VKTRTLILLAMGCGLAILVAGGVFLWRVIANKDELTVPDPAHVGEAQQVGPVRATVVGSTDDGHVLLVQAHLESAEHIDDAGSGWSLLIGGDLRTPVDVPLADGRPCAGTALDPGRPIDCAVAFTSADGDRYVAFAAGGQQRLWQLEPPLP
jgi:hypothetical protein